MRRAGRTVLAIDVGGSHVKLRVSNRRETRDFVSGPALNPRGMMRKVQTIAKDWHHDVVTLGYPGVVVDGIIASEPQNLACGWVGFDFARAFGKPIRIQNDAVMQAIGGYQGRRMLFIGLGTGVGTVLIDRRKIFAMELNHLPFTKRGQLGTFLGDKSLKAIGVNAWTERVIRVVGDLHKVLRADYVVLGGGNAKRLTALPRGARRGHNHHAMKGGFRVWRPPFFA